MLTVGKVAPVLTRRNRRKAKDKAPPNGTLNEARWLEILQWVATNGILSLMTTTVRWHRSSGRRSLREVTDRYKAFILKGLMVGVPEPFRYA
jgi:hypothetical protein